MMYVSFYRMANLRPFLPFSSTHGGLNTLKCRLCSVLACTIFLLPLWLQAQTPQRWEVGGGVGVASYQGDLDAFLANVAQRHVNPAFTLHLRRYAGNLFALRGSVLGGRLSGDERKFPRTRMAA